MKIEYLPNLGFIINSAKIEWNTERNSVREKFQNKHREADETFDMSEFFDGDQSLNISQKRDVYENIFSKNDLLFLNYDEHNRLRDLEIYNGYRVIVKTIQLDFDTEISVFIKQFKNLGLEFSEEEPGNYFFPEFKLSIADSESMGGDGTLLSYFYASSDVSHLME